MAKYIKLENQEATWKWLYLVKKSREGENVTCYQEKSLIDKVVQQLVESKNYPKLIESWIVQHLSDEYNNKLNQAIRARRKRYFNAEKKTTKKKSIDLEYVVWSRLSKMSKKMNLTLSETITYLIDELDNKEQYNKEYFAMKENLKILKGLLE